ncbi:MAG: IgGFc-binding protein [Candidatus Kapabacteria bacterium]|nr:IgGFc-binding protein [Ignavibacteria bacterium]MBK6418610.1 IgGFc-binding protein [Ignavibacteria bacterium]MBK6760575.1 IgGFc-binding protein [Ignavibacteria bacterium]MBP6509481.1 IgGFc-binding protein [Candidatus Kapabacteria bacterium]MBP7092945.1 IgGFc-binding protein [Candidatus Kapabacteria bacterium]
MPIRHLVLSVIVICLCGATWLSAQVERVLPRLSSSSLEGTSFVVGFMANEILQVGGKPRMEVYISSQYDAHVTISSGVIGSYDVFVPANTVRKELMNEGHVLNVSERAYQRAIFVESDVPIVVYTLNSYMYSTDSYSAIPIRHLGTQYYTVNRPTDWYLLAGPVDPLDTIPRVGEFMVMATEDNTLVEITPTTATWASNPAGIPFQVMLRKGDCYLVQAKATAYGADDLSGSLITSNVPVAVLSGHVRSSIPLDPATSKDHLVEQLPPVNLWGRSYATARFESTTRPDTYRVMASRPGQQIDLVTVNGTSNFLLANAGSWKDTSLREPAYWSSPEPFLLVQFMPSSTRTDLYSDPAMVVIPPVEQYVTSSLFQFPEMESSDPFQDHRNYINVIAQASALRSLRVDTTLVMNIAPQIANQRIPGTGLHWAALSLQRGSHTISCDTGNFACVMYGTTIHDSYANMVGVAYEPPPSNDRTPPHYNFLTDCGVISGTVSDRSLDTVELTEVKVITNRSFNYRWQISPPLDTTGIVEFDADVRDLWKDAQIVIHAYDRDGNGKEWLYTYDAPNVLVPKETIIRIEKSGEICTTAVLRNNDTTPVRIVGITIAGDKRVHLGPGQDLDTILAAGDSLAVTICITPTSDTSAAIGWMVVEYPCKLIRQMTVRGVTAQSLTAGSKDFGDVRVGDTVCGRVPIVNDGKKPVNVRTLIAAKVGRGFIVNFAALLLPRVLAPNDTIWVEVCFTPDTLGPYNRVDTVHSTPEFGAQTTYTGRGVRPRVQSVVVNWGKRRIGTVNDTSIVLRNSGDGWCLADADTSGGTTTDFTAQGLLVQGIRLNPADSIMVPLRYQPSQRGPQEWIIPIGIDWKRHEPISITLRGIGVMPSIAVRDIDLGDVEVDSTKDSVAVLVRSGILGGNEPLTIRSVRVSGPDAASFVIPPTLRTLTRLLDLDSLIDRVSFTPRRIGPHECSIEIDHDAAPFNVPATTAFRIIGNGIESRKAVLVLDLNIDASVKVCTEVPVTVTVVNTGNGPMKVDTLVLEGAGRSFDIRPNGQPFTLDAFTSISIDTILMFDRSSATRVTARLVDSAGGEQTDVVTVELDIPDATATVSVNAPMPYVTGPVSVRVTAALNTAQDDTTQPVIVLNVADDRFLVDTSKAVWAEVAEAGSLVRTIPVEVRRTSSKVTCIPQTQTRGSWTIEMELPGTFLWKDPLSFPISAELIETRCFDGSPPVTMQIQVVPCGAAERVVKLGSLPSLGVNVLGQPASETFEVELEASHDMDISVYCETLGGQRFLVSEQFSLQKGIRHCNFSCSGWASGIYRLIFRHGIGVTERLIIIVN